MGMFKRIQGLHKPSKTSIRYKFLAGMILASVVPVMIVTSLTSNNIYRDVRDQVLQSNINSLFLAARNLEDSTERFSNIFYALEVDPRLKEDLNAWQQGNSGQQYAAQMSLENQLISALNSDKNIKAIELYAIPSGKGMTVNFSQTVIKSNSVLEDYLWDREASFKNNYFKRDGDHLSILRIMNRFEDRTPIAGLMIRVDERLIQGLFDFILTRDDEVVFFLNDQDEIVAQYPSEIPDSRDLEAMLTKLDQRNSDHEFLVSDNRYVFSVTTKDGRIRIIKTVPTEAVTKAPYENMFIGISIGLVSSFLALMLAIFLSQLISKPVIQLADMMRTMQISDMRKTEFSTRHDEIGLLEDGFDSMIKRIDELINIEYRSKIETRTAQLNALQAQINPHFIHNTLQLIGGMSLARDSMDVYRITLALSALLRYAMHFDQEMVTIHEELNYLDNYLLIQNLRFSNRFSFENTISEALGDFLIPKLCLQPIIENCFTHGFESGNGKNMDHWYIHVSGDMKNEWIEIKISDNGDGISRERLEAIRCELEEPSDKIWHNSEHIGLKNVDTRLKLHYGEQSGLKIESDYGTGTQVTLLLKAVKRGAENEL